MTKPSGNKKKREKKMRLWASSIQSVTSPGTTGSRKKTVPTN